jgi:hypothetical protein
MLDVYLHGNLQRQDVYLTLTAVNIQMHKTRTMVTACQSRRMRTETLAKTCPDLLQVRPECK